MLEPKGWRSLDSGELQIDNPEHNDSHDKQQRNQTEKKNVNRYCESKRVDESEIGERLIIDDHSIEGIRIGINVYVIQQVHSEC